MGQDCNGIVRYGVCNSAVSLLGTQLWKIASILLFVTNLTDCTSDKNVSAASHCNLVTVIVGLCSVMQIRQV